MKPGNTALDTALATAPSGHDEAMVEQRTWRAKATTVAADAAGIVLSHTPIVPLRLAGFVLSPSVRAKPWAVYERAQRLRPVLPTRLHATLVSRQADVDALLRSRATSVVEANAT